MVGEARLGSAERSLSPGMMIRSNVPRGEAINKLQQEYAEKITPLQEQIKKLAEERDAAVEAVLTAEQKQRVAKARESASSGKKKKASDDPAKPAANASATPAQ